MIGVSIFMALTYFSAQNNQRRASDGRSDYGYHKSDFGHYKYQYADATTGKIVPYIESYAGDELGEMINDANHYVR